MHIKKKKLHTEEEHNIFASKLLYEILKDNNFDINSKDFFVVWKQFKTNINIAQLLDSYLHTELITLLNEKNFDNFNVYWKKAYPNAKVGGSINKENIMAVFTFTIWTCVDGEV